MLGPDQFGILVALSGVGQVLVVGSRVIQTVVTRYISQFRAQPDAPQRTYAFFRSAMRSAWVGGAGITAVLVILSWPLAQFLRIEQIAPVLALMVSALLMVVRPIIGGTLQGEQRFATLGIVQIVQAAARLLAGIVLIQWGWGAFGAMVALPIASFLALLYGIWALGMWRREAALVHGVAFPDLFRYSAYTTAGLIAFAFLLNMDAILVKTFFESAEAGNYATAVTLGKVIQFFPVAIIMVLFPKSAERRAQQNDSSNIVLMALLVVNIVCLGIAIIYFFFAETLIGVVFGSAYQLDPLVLGLLGVAMALLSSANVWLNYFLSIEETTYVYLVWIGVALQLALMTLYHDHLWQLPVAMLVNGAFLTVAGIIFFLRTRVDIRVGVLRQRGEAS